MSIICELYLIFNQFINVVFTSLLGELVGPVAAFSHYLQRFSYQITMAGSNWPKGWIMIIITQRFVLELCAVTVFYCPCYQG